MSSWWIWSNSNSVVITEPQAALLKGLRSAACWATNVTAKNSVLTCQSVCSGKGQFLLMLHLFHYSFQTLRLSKPCSFTLWCIIRTTLCCWWVQDKKQNQNKEETGGLIGAQQQIITQNIRRKDTNRTAKRLGFFSFFFSVHERSAQSPAWTLWVETGKKFQNLAAVQK